MIFYKPIIDKYLIFYKAIHCQKLIFYKAMFLKLSIQTLPNLKIDVMSLRLTTWIKKGIPFSQVVFIIVSIGTEIRFKSNIIKFMMH